MAYFHFFIILHEILKRNEKPGKSEMSEIEIDRNWKQKKNN